MGISVGVIEDHDEFRQSLVFLVSSVGGFDVVWSYGSVEEAIADTRLPEILLLDINLPRLSGLEAILLFKARSVELKIVMLTILEDEYHIMTAIRNGADGYILKKTSPTKIIEAIQHVSEGGAALTPMVARQVLSFFNPEKQGKPQAALLTKREQEILKNIVSGLSNEKIASDLFISTQTVRNHIKSIYEKLQVHTKAQAVAKALQEKMF